MRYWSLFISVGIIACDNDSSLKVQASPPVVTIQQPTDGSEFQQGDALQLRGLIQDNAYKSDLSQIQGSWTVNGTSVCEDALVDLGGNITCDYVFTAAGEITIELQAVSPEATGLSSVTVLVSPNLPPEAEIIAPNGTLNYYSDELVSFDGLVSDTETAITDLFGYWTSSIDGELDISAIPDEEGHVQGTELLSEGTHTITFTAFESETRQGTDTITIEVGGPNQLPTCGIISPIAGQTYSSGEIIEFAGEASDPDIPNSELTAEWRSNVDGVFSSTPVNSDGSFSTGISTLSDGPHTITLSVFDEVGGSCTDSIDVILSSRPTVTIIEPLANEVFNENTRVDFQAEVSDAQDQPQDLLVNWSSSIDGVFSTQSATSNGVAVAYTYLLTPGTHTITVTATDTDGYSSTDQVTLQLNALPLAPEVSLIPTPITSSDNISVSIDVPSIDPEGDPITYNYQWTKNTQLTTHTGSSIPFADTVRGETWEVYVTPNDGYGDGAYDTASVIIANSPPTISAASLSLSSVTELNSVTCSPVGEHDEDGDSITFTYEWYVNGSSVSSNDTINGSLFNRGDPIQCFITPHDTTGAGATVGSSIITVSNSVPSFSGAELTPTSAYEADTLSCMGTGSYDADGDTVTSTYTWDVSGVTIASTSATITGSFFNKGDTVTCHVTPTDGSASGTTITSNSVVILNTPPTANTPSLSPSTAYETSQFLCSWAGGSDVDQGDTVSYTFGWKIDGQVIGQTGPNLDGSFFNKGDAVKCFVTPTDSFNVGIPVDSNAVIVSNSPPSFTNVSISPSNPDTTESITSSVIGWFDADGDSEGYTYQWYNQNGAISGATNASLSSSNTSKNDAIYLQARPFDGTSSGAPLNSSTLTVVNTAPGAPTVEIQPTNAEPGEPLNCEIIVDSDDPDFDNITYTYQWYLGGALQSQYTTDVIGTTTHNQQWQCIVTPNDGTVNGAAGSDSIVVADTTNPDAPVLDAINMYRNEGTITITGTAEPGSSVQIYNNCGQAAPLAFTVPPSGAFSVFTVISAGTTCSYYARATDGAGNTSADSNLISTEFCDPIDSYEVSSSFNGNSCGNAIDDWNILAPSSNAVPEVVTGNIINPTDVDWYVIDTSSNVGSSGINYYNFQVELTTGSGSYDITVFRGDCNAASIETNSSGATSYDSYDYFAQDKGVGTGHLTPSDSRYCQNSSRYNVCDDLSDTYFIKVFRTDGIVNCQEYTLSIQNGY